MLLILLINLQLFHGITSTILADFKNLKEIETLVIYDYKNQGRLINYLSLSENNEIEHTPYIIINQDVSWHLKSYFNKNLLSIVYVETFHNEESLRILYKSLKRRHMQYILFITSDVMEPVTKWWSLFRWCHVNGFFNILLTDFEESKLLTYDHFKTQQIVSTTLNDFLFDSEHFTNTYGFPIRATLGNNPPLALMWYNSRGNLEISGYYATILKMFAKQYNASLEYTIISHQDSYNELDCLDYIASNRADVCSDAMVMGRGYLVTNPEEITYSFLVVPYDKPLDRFYYFVKPFNSLVWFMAWLTLLYNILLLSLIQRLQVRTWDLSKNALDSLMAFANLPFDLRRIKGWRRKFIQVLMIICGFIVANWYLSILSSLLLSRLYSHFISSLEDLVLHNISIMISQYELIFLNISEISPLITQQLRVVENEELFYNRRNLNPAYAYYSQYEKNQYYLRQQQFMQRPRMKQLEEIPINPVYGGIPMKFNWPLEEKLNSFIGYLMDSGSYSRMAEATIYDAIRIGRLKYFPSEHNAVEPLSLQYFHMPAALLLVGYILALISFIMEIIVKKSIRRN